MRQRKQEELEFQVKGRTDSCKTVSDIVYFEKCQHAGLCAFAGSDGSTRIGKICKILRKNWQGKGFVRTHAAYIVALRYCRKV
ncbi:MAG: hypothetical protein ACLSGB_03745 [Dorea sp.]